MTFTYTLGTGRGPRDSLRTLITDVDSANHLFEDEELDDFLGLNGQAVLLAAAMALDVTASNETLIQKRLTLLGRSTDGPGEAVSLRAHAKALRDQYASGLGSAVATFDWAEQITGPFTFDERLLAERLRQAG